MSDLHEPSDAQAPAIGGTEIKKLGYSLYLRIPDNRLECRCSYVPRDLGAMMTSDELAAFLKQYNVREGIDKEAFDGFVVKAAAGQQQVDVLLASGTAPVDGEDEYISLSVTPTTSVHSGDDDGEAEVDMHIVHWLLR